jgi:hypothetical protein
LQHGHAFKLISELLAGILHAPIRVKQQRWSDWPVLER